MREQFIDKLVSQCWHIGFARGRNIIGQMLLTLRGERPSKDIFGDSLPVMQILGDVAIIPIQGVVMCNVPAWIKEWGFNVTDANDIAKEIDEALANPAVAMIILDIDSPGGESVAGEKLYDLVESAREQKPVFAFCKDGGLICSSAYQCAAPSIAILTGKFASVGCIGSYMVYLDDSKYYESLGLKFEVFRSGWAKGIGQEGSLSEEQRNYLQSVVDEFGARFRAGVSQYRTSIDPADMQGQDYLGTDAAARGFSAGTVKDLNEAVSRFKRMI